MLLGVDFYLQASGLLAFAEGILAPEPEVRRLADATAVLLDNVEPTGQPLYYMYRGVSHRDRAPLFDQQGIRFDLTVLVPGKIGREFVKTVGHFHALKPDAKDETFPEYYEVLSGEALYLLQKNSRSGDVEEIIAVEAKKGDKVYVPPNYGHVTVNPGEDFLVMANLVAADFPSLYEPFRNKRGAAYYCIEDENGRTEFIRNPNYHNSVGLKLVPAPNLSQPTEVVKNKTLYQAFLDHPEAFKFLRA
ncbi:MAG: glucose-6-phosphate isomerase [Clostridia bacterium]|nr:glucose-6-phosphate isomerase [Clostridia bacterium]